MSEVSESDEDQSQSKSASRNDSNIDYLSEERLELLNFRQQRVYRRKIGRFTEYLRTAGKDRRKKIGYAKSSIPAMTTRFQRLVDWIWEQEGATVEFTRRYANTVVEALDCDRIRTREGERYTEGSKRKFTDVLEAWFEFHDVEWEPPVTFSDGDATQSADPFTRRELTALWDASLDYKSVPSYNNLSPAERDRWKAHIAQELGKPKSSVRPADWDELNRAWKVPSLIRTTREAGWRPALIEKLKVSWYDDATRTIYIPEGEAIKNDAAWDQQLSSVSADAIEAWLDQRANMERYDGREEIWLNREARPYNSGSLNRLLRKLMDAADIRPNGRRLTWYSFRHSIGTYLFAEYQSLDIVAEVLRQKSRDSAAYYVQQTPELKREAAELM